jgi:hypothetical protein
MVTSQTGICGFRDRFEKKVQFLSVPSMIKSHHDDLRPALNVDLPANFSRVIFCFLLVDSQIDIDIVHLLIQSRKTVIYNCQ